MMEGTTSIALRAFLAYWSMNTENLGSRDALIQSAIGDDDEAGEL